jgi:hypothetical protein
MAQQQHVLAGSDVVTFLHQFLDAPGQAALARTSRDTNVYTLARRATAQNVGEAKLQEAFKAVYENDDYWDTFNGFLRHHFPLNHKRTPYHTTVRDLVPKPTRPLTIQSFFQEALRIVDPTIAATHFFVSQVDKHYYKWEEDSDSDVEYYPADEDGYSVITVRLSALGNHRAI